MPSKLDDLRRRAADAARQATEAAKEFDKKFEITDRLNQGARIATDALRKGADAATSTLDKTREEVSRLDREHKISETMRGAAKQTADAVGEAAQSVVNVADEVATQTGAKETASEVKEKVGEVFDDAKKKADEFVGDAKAKTGDLFGSARKFYDNAAGAAQSGVAAARLPASVLSAVASAKKWVQENPGKTAVVSLAFIAGTRAGSAFASLDVALLGAGGAGNWLFHSAIVPYGLRKLSEKYAAYLQKQEALLQDGKLTEAETERVKFERNLAKYVGAPLLGAFSVAAGAGLVYEAFTGGIVGGLPINLVLGGNPLLSSLWLFGNGLICFHNGYKFFMMALGEQEEVAKVVRDIKGLLPAMA
ncbi:MAG: hypothetical protein HY231_00865 [Acidobacteria bacterium]|nr:hypothetical protein [Acidobacteriota bacterium]